MELLGKHKHRETGSLSLRRSQDGGWWGWQMINSPSMMAVFSIDTMVLWRSSCPRVHCRVSRQCREISPREKQCAVFGLGVGQGGFGIDQG